jgi:hypothetical protein
MAGIVGLTELQHTNATSALSIDESGNLTIKTGTTTVKGEGSNTTNLQQGLAKAWASFNGSSDAIGDSFNTSGITDNGSADYSVGFTTNMGNANYSMYQCGGYSGNSGYTAMIYATSTNEAEFRSVYDDNTLYEFSLQTCAMFGDLA